MPDLMPQVLEHQSTAVVVLSSELMVKFLNPAAEALFEASNNRAAGVHVQRLLSAPGPLVGRLQRLAEDGQPLTLRSQVLILASGAAPLADLVCAKIDGASDLLLEIQLHHRGRGVIHDDRLLAVQESTDGLVRGLAHEIKNPLGGIRGAAQLLNHEIGRADLMEYTAVIIRECDRLSGLVDTLLGPARPPRLAPVNIHELLEHVAQVLEQSQPEAKVTLMRDYDPSLPEVTVDEDQLIQAMLNLVNNALAAVTGVEAACVCLRTRALRQVTLHGQRYRVAVAIEVEDNGVGIPEALLGRVFYPMVSGRPDGAGLGLAITQAIVRRHQGKIDCESRPGRTCFSVILPLGKV